MNETKFIQKIVDVIIAYDLYAFQALPDSIQSKIACTLNMPIQAIQEKVNQRLK